MRADRPGAVRQECIRSSIVPLGLGLGWPLCTPIGERVKTLAFVRSLEVSLIMAGVGR